MNILPINSINTQTQFKAKFPKRDVQEFLREIKDNDVDIVPKLYTLLDVVKNNAGKEARIEHIGLWHRILIDGKSMNKENKYFTAFHALIDATVKAKNTQMKDSPLTRLSESEFENKYYTNRKKTVNDIEKIFEE